MTSSVVAEFFRLVARGTDPVRGRRGLPMLPAALPVILAACWLAAGCTTVPSRPSGGDAPCVECHPPRGDGRPHGVFARYDCRVCHRPHGVAGGLYLQRSLPGLCLACHGDLASVVAPGSGGHAPAASGECGTCHDPHRGHGEALLQQPETQLCAGCHPQQSAQRLRSHAPLAQGCRSCHDPHGSDGHALLRAPEGELCGGCHDLAANATRAAHAGGIPRGRCSTCHDAHGGDAPGLLWREQHGPFASGDCASCHTAAQQGAASDCRACHPTRAAVQQGHGAADAPCSACHASHASRHGGLLLRSAEELCAGCHPLAAGAPSDGGAPPGSVHLPAAEGRCLHCHRAHGPLPLAQPALCSECHGERSVHAGSAAAGEKVPCGACHRPHQSPQRALLTATEAEVCGSCHPTPAPAAEFAYPHEPLRRGECSTCHPPHEDPAAVVACASCHAATAALARHAPARDGECHRCHQPHGAARPFLLASGGGALCVPCHAERSAATGPGHANCLTCHGGHGTPRPGFLIAEGRELCLPCHDLDGVVFGAHVHAPVAAGRCTECHDPHLEGGALHAAQAADPCGSCHPPEAAATRAAHGQRQPEPGACLECHDPHGAADPSLLLPVRHAPFADGRCDDCHEEGRP